MKAVDHKKKANAKRHAESARRARKRSQRAEAQLKNEKRKPSAAEKPPGAGR